TTRDAAPEAFPSRPLEVSRPLPAGDHLVELPLLGAEEMEVVRRHALAEGLARQAAALEFLDRLAQGGGDARQARGIVAVAAQDLRRLHPVTDAVQAGGDRRGVRDVRIGV